ncbi:MAG: HAD family phosphatase [Ruminococcaceae bacterium]|nr:HAD family phosphatase [Oscillospiraceae bacterium]
MDRVILFDMDGVLVNTEPLHYQLWKQVFAERGIDLAFEAYKGCIGANGKRLMELVLEHYGVDFRGEKSVFDRYYQLKSDHLRHGDIPRIEGVNETLAELQKRGWRMAVASSSTQDYIDLCTERVGIAPFFQVRFSAQWVKNTKPAPDVFLAAAEKMGASPEICVVVEDSTNGTLAAKAAGMRCIGFDNPDSAGQCLDAADVRIGSFRELLEVL